MQQLAKAIIGITITFWFFLAVPNLVLANYLYLNQFDLHSFDEEIMEVMGYEKGVINYFAEMATINSSEKSTRGTYESIGCYPFYFLKEGEIKDAGYNCRTFFCTGYIVGSVQCRDRSDQVIGGSVTINNRLDLLKQKSVIYPSKKYFRDFQGEDLTSEMKQRIATMRPIRCKPFYTVEFDDVISGEGYNCEPVGQFPFYVSDSSCVKYWHSEIKSVLARDAWDAYIKSFGESAEDCSVVPDAAKRAESIQLRPSRPFDLYFEYPIEEKLMGSFPIADVQTPSESTSDQLFIDISASHNYFSAIKWGKDSGVLSGYSDGSFMPDKIVNRAEFLKIVLASKKIDTSNSTQVTGFHDVDEQAWYAPYVRYAKQFGIVQGYPDGSFKPDQAVNFVEALKMAYATLEVPTIDAEGEWYQRYLQHAKNNSILYSNAVNVDEGMSRKDVVWIIWKLLGQN